MEKVFSNPMGAIYNPPKSQLEKLKELREQGTKSWLYNDLDEPLPRSMGRAVVIPPPPKGPKQSKTLKLLMSKIQSN